VCGLDGRGIRGHVVGVLLGVEGHAAMAEGGMVAEGVEEEVTLASEVSENGMGVRVREQDLGVVEDGEERQHQSDN